MSDNDISGDALHVTFKATLGFKSSAKTRLGKVIAQVIHNASTNVYASPSTQCQRQIGSGVAKKTAQTNQSFFTSHIVSSQSALRHLSNLQWLRVSPIELADGAV